MTVDELLDILNDAPRDADVVLCIPDGGNYVTTDDVSRVTVIPRRGEVPPCVEFWPVT